jgi:acetolactate synthase-1/2/3 large subunit
MHGTKAANYTLHNSDCIISVGARFDDRVTGDANNFAPFAKIIHMDIDPAAISKIIKVDIPVVGDARNILTQLNKIIEPGDYAAWHKQVSKWKGKTFFTYPKSKEEIKPQAVVEALYKETKGEAVIATEVGQNQMWAAHYYRYTKPRTLLSSGGLGAMGYGMPAAMGAAMGLKKPVIDIAGDGSIQMNIQELATISQNNIPVKVVILNNGYLGMVRQWQELFYNRRYSSTCLIADHTCTDCKGPETCHKAYIPDFLALAKSYNIPAFRAEKPSEMLSVIRKGLKIEGPAIMEFIISREENVFPMVPAGKSIDQIMEEK